MYRNFFNHLSRGCFKTTEQRLVTIVDCHKVPDTFLFISCPDLKLKVNNILNVLKVFKVMIRIRYSNLQKQIPIQKHLEDCVLCRHQSFKSVHLLSDELLKMSASVCNSILGASAFVSVVDPDRVGSASFCQFRISIQCMPILIRIGINSERMYFSLFSREFHYAVLNT